MMFSFIAQSIIKITTYTIKIIFNLIKVKKKIWPYKNFSYKKSNSALNNNKKIKKAMVNLHKSQMNPMRCFIYTLYRKKIWSGVRGVFTYTTTIIYHTQTPFHILSTPH